MRAPLTDGTDSSARALQEPLCESPSDGRDDGDARGDGHGHGHGDGDGDGRQILFAGLPTKISPPPRAHTASHRTHETKTKKFPGSGSSNNGNTPQPPIYIYIYNNDVI